MGSKVSRERFGAELEGMFNGEVPHTQLAICHDQVKACDPVAHISTACNSPMHAMHHLSPSVAGPAPVEAVRLLDRLSLFPVIFALPPDVQQRLGAAYGAVCATVMAAAEAQAKAQSFEVSSRNMDPGFLGHVWNMSIIPSR